MLDDRLGGGVKVLLIAEVFPPRSGGSGRWLWELYRRLDGVSVQVVEKEFTLTLSRPSVHAGKVSLELVNFGMDTHNLVIKSKKAGSKPITFKQLEALHWIVQLGGFSAAARPGREPER
jgi:hypothetical protein